MASNNWKKLREIVKETFDVSAKTTKTVFKEASRKTKELAETGKIRIEIVQLEKKREKLVTSLGETVLQKFRKGTQQSLTPSQVEIKEIMLDISEVERNISIKRALFEQASNNVSPKDNEKSAPPQRDNAKTAPAASKPKAAPKKTTQKKPSSKSDA